MLQFFNEMDSIIICFTYHTKSFTFQNLKFLKMTKIKSTYPKFKLISNTFV